jgi:hypothetical protein
MPKQSLVTSDETITPLNGFAAAYMFRCPMLQFPELDEEMFAFNYERSSTSR